MKRKISPSLTLQIPTHYTPVEISCSGDIARRRGLVERLSGQMVLLNDARRGGYQLAKIEPHGEDNEVYLANFIHANPAGRVELSSEMLHYQDIEGILVGTPLTTILVKVRTSA